MLNINFVPDDYVQNNESRKTNLVCLVLLLIVMIVLGSSFATIKIRQRSFRAKEKLVNDKMTRIQQAIQQFEELQFKRKEMMKTALTTAELIEPVPRSVLLAALTNNLPSGVSLLKLNLIQKEPERVRQPKPTNRYRAASEASASGLQQKVSTEKLLEMHIDIEGMAPSDLQVAAYIERLSSSALLNSVALVESKEYLLKDTIFRRFKLRALLREDIHLSKADIERIREKAEKSVYNF
jgi:hypothetical protein